MAHSSNRDGLAVGDNKEGKVASGVELPLRGSDEIVITIRNGTVVKFVQSVYFSSLEGINGDGI